MTGIESLIVAGSAENKSFSKRSIVNVNLYLTYIDMKLILFAGESQPCQDQYKYRDDLHISKITVKFQFSDLFFYPELQGGQK